MTAQARRMEIPRGAACYWYCCGRLVAQAEQITDPKAAESVAAHQREHDARG